MFECVITIQTMKHVALNARLSQSLSIKTRLRGKAQKQLDIVKKFSLPKMLEIIYETDVYIGILLSESPFIQKSRIQVLENVNWRKSVQTVPRQNGELA